MARTFEDLEIGSIVFIGSRWHRVTRKVKADPSNTYYRYRVDRVMTKCDNYSGYNVTNRILNVVSKDPAPLCKNCFLDGNRASIPTSAISDPEIRAKVEEGLRKGTRIRWTFYVDATQ